MKPLTLVSFLFLACQQNLVPNIRTAPEVVVDTTQEQLLSVLRSHLERYRILWGDSRASNLNDGMAGPAPTT